MGALRLLVADGNDIVRKGLCALVREQRGWEVAAEARNGREAIEIAKETKPDVVIMDIGMPLLNGLAATRQIVKSGLRSKVLLLSSHETDHLFSQALEAGARGYLAKSDTADDLISAVEAMRCGNMFVTARATEDVMGRYAKETGQRGRKEVSLLTERETEVLQLVAEGHSSKQAAAVLKISTKTAETHRANLMKKIDCHTVSALVRYAIRNSIISA